MTEMTEKKAPIFQELEVGEKFIAVSPFLRRDPKKEATSLFNPGLIYDVFAKIPDIPGILGVSKNCLNVLTGELCFIPYDGAVIRVRF